MDKKEVITQKRIDKIFKYFKNTCKFYLFTSGIIIILISCFQIYVNLYGVNKDGEYCSYTEGIGYYHIMVNGEPCILQWKILYDFILFVFFLVIEFQIPALILFLYFKYREWKNKII